MTHPHVTWHIHTWHAVNGASIATVRVYEQGGSTRLCMYTFDYTRMDEFAWCCACIHVCMHVRVCVRVRMRVHVQYVCIMHIDLVTYIRMYTYTYTYADWYICIHRPDILLETRIFLKTETWRFILWQWAHIPIDDGRYWSASEPGLSPSRATARSGFSKTWSTEPWLLTAVVKLLLTFSIAKLILDMMYLYVHTRISPRKILQTNINSVHDVFLTVSKQSLTQHSLHLFWSNWNVPNRNVDSFDQLIERTWRSPTG